MIYKIFNVHFREQSFFFNKYVSVSANIELCMKNLDRVYDVLWGIENSKISCNKIAMNEAWRVCMMYQLRWVQMRAQEKGRRVWERGIASAIRTTQPAPRAASSCAPIALCHRRVLLLVLRPEHPLAPFPICSLPACIPHLTSPSAAGSFLLPKRNFHTLSFLNGEIKRIFYMLIDKKWEVNPISTGG